MGLLERALSYKQKLNEKGKETLIDKIIGPADPVLKRESYKTIDVSEIDNPDLEPETVLLREDTGKSEPAVQDHDKTIMSDAEIPEIEITEINDYDEELILPETDIQAKPVPERLTAVKDTSSDDISRPGKVAAEADESFADPVLDGIQNISPGGDPVPENISVPDDSGMPEFNDYSVLFEIQKELIEAETLEHIYKILLFSIMGQIGVSSASILGKSGNGEEWTILDSDGIEFDSEIKTWDPKSGILSLLDNFRGLLDIEDLKNDINLREDYYNFVSVDARLISPLVYNNELIGAVLVGEKIDSAEFTSSDAEFITTLSELASHAIEILLKYEELHVELLGLRIEKEIMWDVEIMQNTIIECGSEKELAATLQKSFYSLGIENFAIFLNDPVNGGFYPAYFEREDILGFENSGFRIRKDNRLINFYLSKKASIMVENFEESAVLAETFGRERLKKIDIFVSYPFFISGNLTGFISLFKINPAVELIDIDIRIQKIVRFLFPYITSIVEHDPAKNLYNDLTGVLYGRIEGELTRSAELNIPLSMILLSIKNFKRFYDRFGRIEMSRLFDRISVIIQTKLYSADFSVRIDRNKFLLVLPGKDRKYSTTLSGILKNEISSLYQNSDFKLLVSSISSVYPEDGKELFSLLEVLE